MKSTMWVVKLGGSLAASPALQGWLEVLAEAGGGRAIIVPGGGAFANQVRRAQRIWGFDDRTAHHMAILAMQQYGLMLTGLQGILGKASGLEGLQRLLKQGKVAVWLPSIEQLDKAAVPASWDVTSDSLAAWLAREMKAAHLVLVKSIPLDAPRKFVGSLWQEGLVDKAFADFIAEADFRTWLYSRDDFRRFQRALRGFSANASPIALTKPGP